MDIYSSDLKLSELSMNLGPHLSYHHQSLQHQSDSLSSSSLASDSSPLYDNSSAYAIVDVLDFLETGLHEASSPKAYNSFGQDSNTDDNNQWLEFLNPPSEKIEGEVGALTFHDDNNRSSDFLAADRLEFLEDEEKIKSEEHSYSLCKEDDDGDDDAGMNAFKLHFDGDLELFQADDMEQDSFDSGRKLSVIGDLLFVDDQGLSLEEQGPEDRAVPLLDVASQEDLNSASYDYNNNSLSFVAHQSFDKKKFGSARSGGLAEFCPPVCQIKTEPEEMAQEELMFYGNIGNGVDAGGLPPTPPSSGCGLNSDSECSNGGLSGPSSPPAAAREVRKQLDSGRQQHSTSLFSTPIPSSGILILSEEEKRTLLAEGYSLPSKLPLSKQEEKNLKKIRRKIKNKISAQESRRKKKEYLESLEKKVEQITQENCNLKKRVTLLESNNRSLTSELQRLQGLANNVMKNVTKTCATVK